MQKEIVFKGTNLKLDIRPNSSDEPVFEEIFNTQIYTKRMKVEPNEFWVDLGSNCGYFTTMALAFGCRVLSVDADPRNIEQTKKNALLNNLSGEFIHAAVVGEIFQGESISFYASSNAKGLWKSSLFKRRDSILIKVKAITFNKMKEEYKFNCVKMDIEGAEFDIIEGSDFSGIDKMVFEWSFDKDRSIPRFKKALKRLEKYFSKIELSNNMPNGRDDFNMGPKLNYVLVYCWK